MSEVVMISKPVVPPYDDSAKNIVRNQVIYGRRYCYRVLTTEGAPPPADGVATAPIYGGARAYSPGLAQNLKVMAYGLRARGAGLYHYFFAPNIVSSVAGRLQRLVARVKSVQTVCSIPKRFDNIDRLLFSERIIVLSEDTKNRMMAAGVSAGRLVHIRPGIAPIARMAATERRRLRAAHGIPETGRMVLFPGDYEFSTAAKTVSRTVPLLAETHPQITVVFACRIKRPPSIAIRDRIKREIAATGAGERVCFLDKIDDMATFVGSADVVIMPSESLFAKMDVPLVLLEAMSQQVPLVVADVPPLNELLGFGVGVGIPPADERALAEAIGTLIDSPSRAAEMGDAGEAAVRELFNAEKMAATVETVYEEVLQL